MAEQNLTRSMLTLFVTPEKAEEIEGDLIEQARAHGRSWLRVQLVQTWFALAFAAFRREPGHTVLLSYHLRTAQIHLSLDPGSDPDLRTR